MVVPGALAQLAIARRPLPGLAAVVGAKDARPARLRRWPRRGPAARATRRRRSCRACPFRQPLLRGDLRPGVAAVDRFEQAAARAAAVQRPRRSGAPPRTRRRGCADCCGSIAEIARARVLAAEQDVLPASCRRPSSDRRRAPGSARARGRAPRRRPMSGFARVDAHLGDMPRVRRPRCVQVLPRVG